MKKPTTALKIQLLRLYIDSYVFFLSYFIIDVCRLTQTGNYSAILFVFADFFLADVFVIFAYRKKIVELKQTNMPAYYFYGVCFIFSIIMTALLYSTGIQGYMHFKI